jgi:FkbM family methyltransferase
LQALLQLKKLGLTDHKICLNPNDEGLSQQILKNGLREPMNSYYLAKFIKTEKPHVLDVGGNIGYFPLIELLSGAESVTVYEPVSETFGYLLKNVKDFKNVICRNSGLSDHAGEQTIYIPEQRNLASVAPDADYLEFSDVKIVSNETVTMATLPDVCENIESSNILVRMDVEGYEATILQNIPENVKHISFEFHTQILGQKASIDFIEHLESQGFKVFLMLREMEGLIGLFKRFGFSVFSAYSRLKEKRIYTNPTKQQICHVISLCRENPHIFASRM